MVIKVDKEGNEIWNKSFGRRWQDVGRCIVKDGNYYVIAGETTIEAIILKAGAWIIKCNNEEPAKIKIIRPKRNYLYIFDREVMPYDKTMAIGGLTFMAEGEGKIKEVRYYLDRHRYFGGHLPKAIRYKPPYKWKFKMPAIAVENPYVITCAAYYGNAGAVAVDKIEVYIINLL